MQASATLDWYLLGGKVADYQLKDIGFGWFWFHVFVQILFNAGWLVGLIFRFVHYFASAFVRA